MIKRIVKMTFAEDKTDFFLASFWEVQPKIEAFEGCVHLEIWRDTDNPNIFFTYSFWKSEEHLQRYRRSDLFKSTWEKTKKLFAGKPEAWSVANLEKSVQQENDASQ